MRRGPAQLPKPGGQAGDEATASASPTHSSRPLPRERQTRRPLRTQPRGGPFREEQTSRGPFPGPLAYCLNPVRAPPFLCASSPPPSRCPPASFPSSSGRVRGDSPSVPGPEAQAVTQRHRPPPPGLGQPKSRGSRRKPQPSSGRQGPGTETPSSGPLWGVLGPDTTEKLSLRNQRIRRQARLLLPWRSLAGGLGGSLSSIDEIGPRGPPVPPPPPLQSHPVCFLPKALGPLVLLLFPVKTYFRSSLE